MDLLFPLNYAAWTYAALAILLYALRNQRLYTKSHNILHRDFARFMTVIGASLMVYAAPPLFVESFQVLAITTVIGDFLIALSLAVCLVLMKNLGIITHRQMMLAAVLTVACALVILVSGLMTNEMVVGTSYVLYHELNGINAALFSILFAIILLPVGIFFAKKSKDDTNKTIQYKTLTFGLVFILAGLVSIYNYGFMRGQDSLLSALIIFITFSALYVLALTPITQKTVDESPLRQKEKGAGLSQPAPFST